MAAHYDGTSSQVALLAAAYPLSLLSSSLIFLLWLFLFVCSGHKGKSNSLLSDWLPHCCLSFSPFPHLLTCHPFAHVFPSPCSLSVYTEKQQSDLFLLDTAAAEILGPLLLDSTVFVAVLCHCLVIGYFNYNWCFFWHHHEQLEQSSQEQVPSVSLLMSNCL